MMLGVIEFPDLPGLAYISVGGFEILHTDNDQAVACYALL